MLDSMIVYSNEIVFRGHPDKVCDQISDALVDEYILQDKNSRCAIEVLGSKNLIVVAGEVTSKAIVNIEYIVKKVLKDIGYNSNYNIIVKLDRQSNDIALGTNKNNLGAGDNGMMFGYATKETEKLLPKAMVILQEFSMFYDELRKVDKRFLPDGKAQITGYYDNNMNLKKIKTFTICYQNTEEERNITDDILKKEATKICDKYNVKIDEFLINSTSKFSIGGFDADTGLTGRKIVVDTYQSFAKVGGGAFSGKDPTKVDRSGAYKARILAIRYLKKYNLDWCSVQLSYAIGMKKPLSIYINSNIGSIDVDDLLYEECTPSNIIKDLDLLNVNYEELARFGHFKDEKTKR